VVIMLRRAFLSLGYPNYRRWFTGQVISLAGTWMQTTALSYLAFELTRSPAFLGVMAFAQGIPTWIFMIYAGTLVDRFSRRNILIITQIMMMLLAILMVCLTRLSLLQPWHILIVSGLLGIINSFDAPARQSFASELVARKDLTNALALNGALFNLASTIGPAVAGVLYVIYGPTLCFALNALSFFAVLMALWRIELQKKDVTRTQSSVTEQLKEGIVYAFSHRTIAVLIFLVGIMSLFGVSVVTIFPAWAVHQLEGDASVAGYLQAGRGFGAFLGAMTVAYFSSSMMRERWIMAGAIGLPLTLIAFAITTHLFVALASVAMLGVTQIMILNLSNSLIHSTVEDHLRGRVASIFGLTFFGLMPLGGLMMGSLAEWFSERLAVIIVAILFAAAALAALGFQRYFLGAIHSRKC
jgi:MFS family permease